MSLSEDQLNKYVQWTRDGRSFSEIRDDLKSNGYHEDVIKKYIVEIDDAAIRRAVDNETVIHRINFKTIGIVILTVGGVLFGVGLYAGQLSIGIAATFSVGLGFIFAGWRLKLRKKLSTQRAGRRRFNLKRSLDS